MTTQQGSHFWIMVMMIPGGRAGSYQGTITPRPSATRFDMFNQVREEIRQRAPETATGVVVSFDIQPNKL
ncbi:hypothetical protein [Streptomyces sp. R33]|uniref:Uncharacterized protein n=1 Tax=Streptomyces sp. R33 TaxID=3238629 RepID=A0AB39YCW8_9ACTN